MTLTLKAAREKRAELAKAIREYHETHGDTWTETNEARWTELNAEYDDLGRQLEKLERIGEIDDLEARREEAREVDTFDRRRDDREVVDEETRCVGLAAWFRAQLGEELTREHRDAAKRCRINPYRRALDVPLPRTARTLRSINGRTVLVDPTTLEPLETREMTTVLLDGGGALVPDTFVNRFERAKLMFGGMRIVSEIIRTATGGRMRWPSVNDTSNKGRRLNEGKAVTETNLAPAGHEWDAYKYSSDLVRVAAELLEDSAFDLARILGDVLGERIARKQNEDFTLAAGGAAPYGITLHAATGDTLDATTAITADELEDFYRSVDPAYRMNAQWMMNDGIVGAIRKLKGSDNNYLWQPGLAGGDPDTLKGKPVVLNQDMASAVTASAVVATFGDHSYYKIREVGSVRFRRLVERYADEDEEGFVAFERADGALLDAGTNPVKKLVAAAS